MLTNDSFCVDRICYFVFIYLFLSFFSGSFHFLPTLFFCGQKFDPKQKTSKPMRPRTHTETNIHSHLHHGHAGRHPGDRPRNGALNNKERNKKICLFYYDFSFPVLLHFVYFCPPSFSVGFLDAPRNPRLRNVIKKKYVKNNNNITDCPPYEYTCVWIAL